MDILTITLNPALDISTHAPEVVAGPKLRCSAPIYEPGGGGINVSRAISILGGSSRAFVAVGGAIGSFMKDLMRRDGIAYSAFPVDGDTRQSLAVTSDETGGQFRFVLPGPIWTEAMTQTALAVIEAEVATGMMVIGSGSLPLGVPASIYADVNEIVLGSGGNMILDTSGPALDHCIEAPTPALFALRMDTAEAEEQADRALPTASDVADFAQSLVAKGAATHVVIGFGAGGNVGVSANARHLAVPPHVTPVSKVGAGDSFVGAFAMSMSKGEDLSQALLFGTAAATSAVTTEATRLCEGQAARKYLKQIKLMEC